jgi:ribosomal protein S18 acetylase RimI-like enzyme
VIHLILDPLTGDPTLKPPDYQFSKVAIKDYGAFVYHVTACGAFKVKAEDLYKQVIYTLIAAYMVKDKKKTIGCAALVRCEGQPEVEYLWVDPEYRRKRIAWTLLNMCMLRAKVNTYSELHGYVDVENIPAQELFKKAGFKEAQ